MYPSGQGFINNVDCFNFDTLRWERKANAPDPGPSQVRIGSKAVYDPVSRRVFLQTGLTGSISSYDPASDSWQMHDSSSWTEYHMTAAIDPVRRVMVIIGEGRQYVLDLTSPSSGLSSLGATGATGIINNQAPGLVYDPVSDRFVAWHGGTNVYVLNMDTRVWTLVTPAASNTVVPGRGASVGTYGRFKYVPSKNVFVAVSRENENVFLYRLPNREQKGK